MKGKMKRWTAMLLTGVIVMTYAPVGMHAASIAPDAGVRTTAVPIYSWGFENNEVEGSTVANSVYPHNSEGNAELHAGASVVQDEERGRVLSLPGGQAGSGGWLSLPDDLYSQVTDELTVAMWVNVASDAGAYHRLFSSTIKEKSLSFSGINSWNDPEFSFVTGGDTYEHRIFTGTNPAAVANYKGDMSWNTAISKGKWQHVVVSMTKAGAYNVFLDGVPSGDSALYAGNSTAGATVSSVMQAFFERSHLDALQYNGFGRSLYTSDADVKGKFDDIQLYNVALSSDEVKAVYDRYFLPEMDNDISYYYSFDQVEGKTVQNGVEGGSNAEMGAAAAVVPDVERGGAVLSLPGGGAVAGSWLTLPQDLFSGVNGDDGFAMSLWLNVPADGASYSRLFSASPYPLGQTNAGNNWWTDPEFAVVRGGGDYHARLFNGVAANSAAEDGVDIAFDRGFEADTWQIFIVTVKNDAFDVYLDGQKIADIDNGIIKRFAAANLSEALPSFFDPDYLTSLVHSALGRSLYTSDNNFTGKIDDFAFYTRYLTAEDAASISGVGDSAALHDLLEEAKLIEQGNYTTQSYQFMQNVIAETTALLAEGSHPQGVINEALNRLQGAINSLKEELPSGIHPDYYYTFDSAADANGNVLNDAEGGTHDASLKVGAQIKTDAERGQVLNLPGGSNGSGGSLSLPAGLFEGVTAEGGFTVAMWAKLNSSVHGWSRLFDASPTDYGSGTPPFFYVSALNGSEVNTGTGKEYMSGYATAKGEWTHVAYSVKGNQQIIYVNGAAVKAQNADSAIFDLVENFTKNSIGRSRFSADPDLKAQIDDVMFFKNALSADEITTIVGSGYNAALKSITIGDHTIAVKPGQSTYQYPIDRVSDVPALDEIILEKSNPESKAAIKKLKTFSYLITVTSPNGKVSVEYKLEFIHPTKGATASFFMNQTNGEIMHGASGFLYGLSEPNVPTIDLLSPLKPKVVVQKAPGGLQHPSGDGVRLSDALIESGVEQIQIYIQDMYYQWPYEYNGLDQYEQLAVETVRKAKSNKNSGKFVYVIFNEPDGIWFNGQMNEAGFFAAFKRIYDAVKAEDPNARVAGPNLAGYNKSVMEKFMDYCVVNDCIPDVMTWHELGNDGGSFEARWEDNYNHYRSLEAKHNIPKRQIVINEYSWFEDPGAAGSLIQWMARFETQKVYGSIAYWHLANSLNELAADANKPNGAWWLYKWYADMTGETVALETYNAVPDGMYGLASIDNEKRTAYTIFGGQDGVLTASMHDLADSAAFEGADSVHVKLYRSKFTGYYGTLEAPRVEFEGNVALTDGTLNITVPDANGKDGFFAIVTPASNNQITEYSDYERIWTTIYEAENAALGGVSIANQDASPASGGRYVSSIPSGGSVTFTVNVPQDGVYKLEVYYGNNALTTNGRNRAQGDLAKQLLKIDGDNHAELTYDSTIFNDYFASKTLYVNLKAGTHTLHFSKSGGLDASLDKVDLTYAGALGSKIAEPYLLEAEEADYGSGFDKASTLQSPSSGTYIAGSGEVSFTVVVKENGYYDLKLGYASEAAGEIDLYKKIVKHAPDATPDTTLTTSWSSIGSYALQAGTAFASVSGNRVYLSAGANTIKIASEQPVSLDYLQATYDAEASEKEKIVLEAETGHLFGTAKAVESDNFSSGEYVAGIGESKENGVSVNVTVKEAGAYKLSIDYSNNEPAPAIVTAAHPNGYIHPYNTDLVERYAQIVVNGGTPQTVYFINTLAWNSVRNTVVDIELQAGENTITFYNDNSYRFSNVIQYAPYFDKFEIAKATLEADEETNENSGNNGSNTNPNESQIDIMTDGENKNIRATVLLSETEFGKSALVQLDNNMLIDQLNKAAFKLLTIPVHIDAREVIGELNGQLLKAMENKGTALELKTDHASYLLPSSEIKIDDISKKLGTQIALQDLKIRIKIAELTAEQAERFIEASDGKLNIIATPVEFKAEVVYKGHVVEVKQFDNYVTRMITIPAGVDPNRITTGMVQNEDGTVSHVPTKIVQKNGIYYAVINSMTNSVYTVISNPVSFADIETHWSRNEVNDMASRLIIKGVNATSFMPDKSITRAEFAAVMVRALGLREARSEGIPSFSDMPLNAWYKETVAIAASYGLIDGYQDSTFRPDHTISRAEAMVIIERALKLTLGDSTMENGDISQTLAVFEDAALISDWALAASALAVREGIVQGHDGKLAPGDNLTRAQAAVMIRRMLEKSALIGK
ncbi:LamG-like jellyroll fold domain-containing protein [Paenibacillus sp. LHD-38]|uniref:LamG-like jellyroll fold domain-containing protein n=1 Tax=Paenibacillus sp. LHD-38 TaxID=3072143 RepID=UPI00280D0807|nr:LamG-like jellyroll fold domain-containing protein [Paenibacillus sp. LHD-38]MDQ8734573.1 LamG-like jellyroll fold domain-containing protein [Paenibacillus sp. LHD-38]